MAQGNAVDREYYIGVLLAISSNLFIGTSFIIKKKALVKLQKYGLRAGSGGHGYLREWIWWSGLLSMGIGEATNFIAYAFAPATVVTPLGVLSIVVAALLSPKYLNEKLNILGKIGCFLSILGSIIIVLHAPKFEEVDTIDDLLHKIHHSGFIIYIIFVMTISGSIAFYFGPKCGTDNVIIYIILCSTVGSLTVMNCKVMGLALKETIQGELNRMEHALTWLSLFTMLLCIIVQMNYLNKALDLFNTAIVTPVYYVFFTTFVIIASAILFGEWRFMTYQAIVGSFCGFFVVITAIFLMNAFKDLKVTYTDLKAKSVSKRTVSKKDIEELSLYDEEEMVITRDVTSARHFLNS